MPATPHYFGIRHHGPGSARRLRDALDALRPSRVLIEGPADASDLLPALADAAMRPPVALLSHAVDAPDDAVFHPFAEFSPEYQAVRWAVANAVPVAFIDLPASLRPPKRADDAVAAGEGDGEPGALAGETAPGHEARGDEEDGDDEDDARLRIDPIGAIAEAAGYEDGEAWWNDWIESATDDRDPLHAFEAVAEIMATLRERHPRISRHERRREAHMRLAIAAAAKEADGAIAVVCGAWHVPALRAKHRAGDDRALLAGLPKRRMQSTWVPWTSPRLAYASGYGAGVAAPRWYAHLWRHGDEAAGTARWVVSVARTFRAAGLPVSTASVIETVRMATALAALRGRPRAGFEEIRDAVVACVCGGESLPWDQHADELLLGREVGAIPPDTPLMPLLEDLQRQQKRVRLKPEALPRELALDLRTDSGAERSTLLHRLRLLDVDWGRAEDAGRSRGTFRERWTLAWQPEFAVRLVEHLAHGPTIARAAAARSAERMRAAAGLDALVELIHACLEAQLPDAVDAGLALLDERAGHAQECRELLEALPALIALRRYGSARALALDRVGGLVERLLVQAALALPYAARHLDAEQAAALCRAIQGMQASLDLAEVDPAIVETWWRALDDVADDAQSDRRVCGLACRLLYTAERIDADALRTLMQRMLSPGVATADAARFFEGFFEQGARRLLHDDALLAIVDAWLLGLAPDVFQAQLPLFRRVFSELDAHERRRLLDRILRPRAAGGGAERFDADLFEDWEAQRGRLSSLLRGEAPSWPN